MPAKAKERTRKVTKNALRNFFELLFVVVPASSFAASASFSLSRENKHELKPEEAGAWETEILTLFDLESKTIKKENKNQIK